MRTLAPLLILAATTLVTNGPLGSRAQAQSRGDDAQTAFEAGMDAARAGRWQRALTSFERARELHPDDRLLINVAGALVQLGRLVEAERTYREFLDRARDDSLASYREAAREGLARIRLRMPTLLLTLENTRPGDRLFVDEREVASTELDTGIRLDPGSHVVRVERDGRTVGGMDVELEEGESSTATLAVAGQRRPALAVDPPATPLAAPPEPSVLAVDEPATEDDDSGGIGPAWAWVGTGALVVAGIVVAIVATGAADDSTPEFSGTLMPGQLRLSR